MKNNTLIVNNAGYRIEANITKDASIDRVSVTLVIYTPDNTVLGTYKTPRTKVLRNRQTFAYLLDSTAMFSQEDVERVQTEVQNMLTDIDIKDVDTANSKVMPQEVYSNICMYFSDKAVDLDKEHSKDEVEEIIDAGVFQKGKYLLIKPEHMQDFLNKHRELGYSRIEILRWLKSQQKLEVGQGREYDKQISVLAHKIRVYKIICEMQEHNEEVEKIDVKLTENDEPETPDLVLPNRNKTPIEEAIEEMSCKETTIEQVKSDVPEQIASDDDEYSNL